MRLFSTSRRLLVGATAIAVAGGIAGASVAASNTTNAATAAKVRIGFVLPDLANPFIAGIRDGAVAEAKKQGVTLLVKGSNDPAGQTNAFLNYVGAKVNAIGIDSIDSKAIIPAVKKANDAGISVVAVQAQPAGGKLTTFIAADNFRGGVLIGEAISTYCKGKNPCKVGIVQGILADQSGADEERGMRSVVKKFPNIKIVSAQPTNYDPAKALNVATNMLTANPDLNYIYSWWDQGALSALEAARSKGKAGRGRDLRLRWQLPQPRRGDQGQHLPGDRLLSGVHGVADGQERRQCPGWQETSGPDAGTDSQGHDAVRKGAARG